MGRMHREREQVERAVAMLRAGGALDISCKTTHGNHVQIRFTTPQGTKRMVVVSSSAAMGQRKTRSVIARELRA